VPEHLLDIAISCTVQLYLQGSAGKETYLSESEELETWASLAERRAESRTSLFLIRLIVFIARLTRLR